MKTWIKLYTEINRDPDIGTLTWTERGIWSALLALAGEIDDRDHEGLMTGMLPPIDEVAWHIRCDVGVLENALLSFGQRDLVDVDIDRQIRLHKYAKRQAPDARLGKGYGNER